MTTVPLRKLVTPYLRLTIAASLACAALSGLPASAFAAAAHAAGPVSPAAAIARPQRSHAERMRDVYRHPEQTLRFFGLTDRLTVIEIAPGGGWYTEILAPYLRTAGKLYEAPYVNPDAQDAAREAPYLAR